MSITTDTRFESLQKTNRQKLYRLILTTLAEYKKQNPNSNGLTAREIAVMLYNQGYLISNERQATAPRLTELVNQGSVVVVGKKKDVITQKNVAAYAVK